MLLNAAAGSVAAEHTRRPEPLEAGFFLLPGDTVAVVGTRNLTGETIFDDSLKEALVLGLEQSPFLSVDSETGTGEAMEGPAFGSEVHAAPELRACIRSEVAAVVRVMISKEDGRYQLTLQARSCRVEKKFAQIVGHPQTKYAIIQELSHACSALRRTLGEPKSSVADSPANLERMILSLDALNYFSKGRLLQRRQGDAASLPFFQKAIESDSLFSLPYSSLAAAYRNLRAPALEDGLASEAYELRSNVANRERLRIESTYFAAQGQLESEIKTYRQWEQKYPRDLLPHTNLGDAFFGLGRLEQALDEYNIAVQIAPSVSSYSKLMGVQLSLNQFEQAGQTYQQALAKNLDGRLIRQTDYWLSFVLRDAAQMKEQVDWADSRASDKDTLLSLEADTAAYSGHVGAARSFSDEAVNVAMKQSASERAALWRIRSALTEAELGYSGVAEQDVNAALLLSRGREVTLFAALTLARIGNLSRAQSLIDVLEKTYSTNTLMQLYWIPTIRAACAIHQRDPSRALTLLSNVYPYELGGAGTMINYLYPAYLRGQALLLAGKPLAAAYEFEKLRSHPGIVINFVTGALIDLELGRAYAMAGDSDKAKMSYQLFLVSWRDADPDLIVVAAARSELSHLR